MKQFKNHIVMAGGLVAFVGIVAGITAGPAIAQVVKAALVTVVLPPGAFTIPPSQLSLGLSGSVTQQPDPSGTRYAITSVVLSNPSAITGELVLEAIAFGANATTCLSPANEQARADGPRLTFQANSTATISFPQPFVTAPVSGTRVCLVASGNNTIGVTWSAVGYKLQ